MWLHFADVSVERGQYAMLVEHGITATLVSYFYLREPGVARAFEKLWEAQMQLHLVAFPHQKAQKDALKEATRQGEPPPHLLSYAYAGEEKAGSKLRDSYEEVWKDQVHAHLTATHTGPEIGEAMSAEGANKHLISNAYRGREKWYEPTWEEQSDTDMHLATTSESEASKAAMDEEGVDKTLASYARATTPFGIDKPFERVWNREDLRPRVIIDSGAFTAHTTGKAIKLEEYAEWALAFKKKWEGRFASLVFINLDVIGDQEQTWKNQKRLESLGIDPIPVLTFNATRKDVHRAFDGYPYVCLGGLVGGKKPILMKWLDPIFKEAVGRFRKTGTMPRVHLLGVTQRWALERYPLYSCDSSGWTAPLRYGVSRAMGKSMSGKRIPAYTKGESALSVTMNSLRAEIRKFKQMERDATALWAKRGVTFDD